MEPRESQPVPEAPETSAQPAPKRKGEGFWENLRSLAVVLATVLVFRTFIAEATVIPTGSMEKTILVGDHVFLSKFPYGPQLPFTSFKLPAMKSVRRQEIVAFHYPRNPSVLFVKRAVGLSGDVVRIENRKVYVNGAPLDEPYVQYQSSGVIPLRDNFPPPVQQIAMLPAAWGLDPVWAREMPQFVQKDGLRVPPGYLFVMGDNRDNSLDSRFWGFVPESNVVGEPLIVYWSYDAPSKDWTAEDIPERVRFNLSIAWNFLQKTRWSRTGKTF